MVSAPHCSSCAIPCVEDDNAPFSPLGAFELPPFDAATTGLAKAVAAATVAGNLRSVGGGGDTVSALRHAGVIDQLTYVSSAGGAFLEWLEGKTLPGVAALSSGG